MRDLIAKLALYKLTRHAAYLFCCALLFSLTTQTACSNEHHDEPNGFEDRLQLHLFGTLGASYHDEDGLEYRRSLEQKNGVSANQLDFSSDSLLGGQADLQITQTLSASTQVVSRNNSKGNWKPELIAGFLRYQPNENIQIRIGRMPTFSNVGAETRYVSYAYTEVRPSVELYGLFSPLDRYDGISLEYTTPIASGIGKVLLSYGETVGELFVDSPTNSTDIEDTTNTGVGLSWQRGDLEALLLYNHYRVKNDDNYIGLAQFLSATPFPVAQQRAQDIRDTQNYSSEIWGAAFSYTPGAWKIKGVIGKGRYSDFTRLKSEGASVMVGYNIGQFTPYFITAYARASTDKKPSGVLNLTPALAQLNAGYDTTFALSRIKQESISLGLRYDIAKNYALKFQVDKVNADSTPVILSNRNADADKDLTLMTIALDFLF